MSSDHAGTGRPASREPATLARSIKLFKAFRKEQTDPEHFYKLLARDTVAQMSRYCSLSNSLALDVGGGPGHLAMAMREAGALATFIENEPEELLEQGRRLGYGIIGDGCRMPFADAAFDVSCSSNVLEHTPEPLRMLDELVRVARPGGLVFVTFTNWYSPWGGHETSPWHYLGGERAARRFERRNDRPPKNLYGSSLFQLHVSEVLAWARAQSAAGKVRVIEVFPRYYPRWARWIVSVPILRELATWNLAIALRRTPDR